MKMEVLKTLFGLVVLLMIIGWAGTYDYEEQVEIHNNEQTAYSCDDDNDMDSAEQLYTSSYASWQ